MAERCTHLDTFEAHVPDEIAGCEECLEIGSRWVHLRLCRECGNVGCCDDSPHRHATAHFHQSGHPVIRSVERGEDWSFCYVDQVAFVADFPDERPR